jgi:hypothetical protein
MNCITAKIPFKISPEAASTSCCFLLATLTESFSEISSSLTRSMVDDDAHSKPRQFNKKINCIFITI